MIRWCHRQLACMLEILDNLVVMTRLLITLVLMVGISILLLLSILGKSPCVHALNWETFTALSAFVILVAACRKQVIVDHWCHSLLLVEDFCPIAYLWSWWLCLDPLRNVAIEVLVFFSVSLRAVTAWPYCVLLPELTLRWKHQFVKYWFTTLTSNGLVEFSIYQFLELVLQVRR